MPWGALIAGAASAGLGAIGSHKANTARRTARGRGRRILDRLQGITDRSFLQQEDTLNRGLADLLRGFDIAKGETARIGRGAKRQAADLQTQMEGKLGTDLGYLKGSSVGVNASRALNADYARRLQDIDMGLADIYGNIATGRGQASYGGQAALADLQARKLASDTGIQNERYGLFTGGEMAAPASFDLGGLGDILGQLGSFKKGSDKEGETPGFMSFLKNIMGSFGG